MKERKRECARVVPAWHKQDTFNSADSHHTILHSQLHADGVAGPNFEEVFRYTMNPKAVSISELFGAFHPVTREWADGLAGKLIREACDELVSLYVLVLCHACLSLRRYCVVVLIVLNSTGYQCSKSSSLCVLECGMQTPASSPPFQALIHGHSHSCASCAANSQMDRV